MNLLAVSMNKTSIWVFRLDGERVYSINNRSAIVHLRWNDSGKFFAVSGAENVVNVYETNNGNLVNKFASATLPITLTSWCSVDVKKSIASADEVSPYQDFYKVDILGGMPKLSNEVDTATEASTIPMTATPNAMSTSVTNTNKDDSMIDYLLVINSDTLMSVTFNNLFTVADIELPANYRFLAHAMAKDLFSQLFLMEDSEGNLFLQKFYLDLKKGQKRKHLLNIIRWCSHIVSIINHIIDQVSSITAEAATFMSLFDRYLGNYRDTLYSGTDLTAQFPTPDEVEDKMVDDLTDMVMTGLVPEYTKDYWLNQFGERGLMKLSASGNAAFDSARKILFTQIILALEKLIILLSMLEGVARAEKSFERDQLGISLESITKALDLAKAMVNAVYDFIWKLNDEQEALNKFLNWCKVEVIEKLAKQDNEPEAFLRAHPTVEFKTSAILEYFEHSMFHSIFMDVLEVDCSNNEILMRDPQPPSLPVQIDSLKEEITGSLLKGIQEYISLKVAYNEPLLLDVLSKQLMCALSPFDSSFIVTAANDNKLSVVHVADSSLTKQELVFPGRIVSSKLINKQKLLVLAAVGPTTYKLDLVQLHEEATSKYEELDIVKSLAFDANTFVKDPAYLTVNGCGDSSRIIGSVLDATKKEYVVFQL